jgi:ATP-dependent helicase/nuclease subunit A
LADFYRSDVYRWIGDAVRVYRELPFIWDNGKRIIHGVIDMLLQRPDDSWVIVDYKTSYLPKNATLVEAQDHAQRFHMQMGAYAEAVLEHLRAVQKVDAVALAVYIHYIHSGQTVEIAHDEWRAALDKMEPSIGRLIGL